MKHLRQLYKLRDSLNKSDAKIYVDNHNTISREIKNTFFNKKKPDFKIIKRNLNGNTEI